MESYSSSCSEESESNMSSEFTEMTEDPDNELLDSLPNSVQLEPGELPYSSKGLQSILSYFDYRTCPSPFLGSVQTLQTLPEVNDLQNNPYQELLGVESGQISHFGYERFERKCARASRKLEGIVKSSADSCNESFKVNARPDFSKLKRKGGAIERSFEKDRFRSKVDFKRLKKIDNIGKQDTSHPIPEALSISRLTDSFASNWSIEDKNPWFARIFEIDPLSSGVSIVQKKKAWTPGYLKFPGEFKDENVSDGSASTDIITEDISLSEETVHLFNEVEKILPTNIYNNNVCKPSDYFFKETEDQIICCKCGAGFKNSEELIYHLDEDHATRQIWMCSKCDIVGKNMWHVVSHMNDVHKVEFTGEAPRFFYLEAEKSKRYDKTKLVLPDQPRNEEQKKMLERLTKIDSTARCIICDRKYGTYSRLVTHCVDIHSVRKKDQNCQDRFLCPFGHPDELISPQDFLKHIKADYKRFGGVPCFGKKCVKVFPTFEIMQTHMANCYWIWVMNNTLKKSGVK